MRCRENEAQRGKGEMGMTSVNRNGRVGAGFEDHACHCGVGEADVQILPDERRV